VTVPIPKRSNTKEEEKVGNLTLLNAAAVLALLGCAPSASAPWSSSTVTAATVTTSDLDDAQIAAAARKVQADQGVLAGLAARQGDGFVVRSLGRRFEDETSADLISTPGSAAGSTSSRARASVLEDELAQRDVATEMRLARYGGRSFDDAFLDAQAAILEADVELLERTLVPRATDPTLKAQLAGLASLLSRQLDAVRRASSAPEGAR
jgi:Domain of unknown function (DUF4142)